MIEAPSLICPNLYTSGEFDYEIPEEALVIDTKKGLVVLTGCAHPGIISMLGKIKNAFGKNIFMVCGGFHLMDKSDKEMKAIISEMKKLGVVKCGATHCTGEKQIKLFKDDFKENYVELGTGNKVVIN
jgi:7,8-dihydropterin-6-yl-methyl-4-(beta-D-ribofuranosyl)aminobenzene 5'-phosphate synthase